MSRISELAQVVGCSRSTVKAALANDGPRYVRAATGRWWMGSEPWGFDLVVVAVKITNGKIATFTSRIRSRNH